MRSSTLFRVAGISFVAGIILFAVSIWLINRYYEDAALSFGICILLGLGCFVTAFVALVGGLVNRPRRNVPMTDAPKKRPWFQFHLSTAVVLMFVAGGLMWANTHCESYVLYSDGGGDDGGGCTGNKTYLGRGWPLEWHFSRFEATPDELSVSSIRRIPGERWRRYTTSPVVLYWRLTLDLTAGFAVIAATSLVCEWSIRRRERRQ